MVRSFDLVQREPLLEGAALPPLWHWFYFHGADPVDELGTDGHAAKGGFLPPIDLPRRMWARGRMSWRRPFLVGERCRKFSSVEAITPKQGRSGPLVFVEVHHRFEDALGVEIATEIHDIVYREAPSSPVAQSPDSGEVDGRAYNVNSVQLFRYSALTFNSHRIHYDADYVRDVEGYPGLIVHGPLLATLALDAVQRDQPEWHPHSLDFKMHSPVFLVGEQAVVFADLPEANQVRLRHRGQTCLSATVD